MQEVNRMTTRILLVCAFGLDIADMKVDYWIDGVLGKRSVGYSLETTFQGLVQKITSPHIQLFPFLAKHHITPWERDLRRNAEALRNFVEIIINQRRE